MIRVLVCMDDALLGVGLKAILSKETDFHVELCTSSDPGILMEAFDRYPPQVVILHQNSIELKETLQAIVSTRRVDVHLILINDDTNFMDSIFLKKHHIADVSDLLSVIRVQ